jgi:RNA polymerase sigma-32 factor
MVENKEEEKEKEYLDKALPVQRDSLKRYMAEVSKHPVLSREEEYKLAMRYRKKGDLEAAKKLITSNLRFVIKIAYEYKNYGLNLMELIQEGNIGLMQAVKKFDPTRGYRLITYAVWWIRAYIQSYIIRTWSLVKIGTTQAQKKLFYKLGPAKRKMEMTEEKLSLEDYKALARELGVSDEAVMEMEERMGAKDISLDVEIKEEGEGATHLDLLVDKLAGQEEVLARIQEEEKIKRESEAALKSLEKRERFIIENRILREDPLTLEELGTKLNISRERVRQIENEALKKMKMILKNMGVSR